MTRHLSLPPGGLIVGDVISDGYRTARVLDVQMPMPPAVVAEIHTEGAPWFCGVDAYLDVTRPDYSADQATAQLLAIHPPTACPHPRAYRVRGDNACDLCMACGAWSDTSGAFA